MGKGTHLVGADEEAEVQQIVLVREVDLARLGQVQLVDVCGGHVGICGGYMGDTATATPRAEHPTPSAPSTAILGPVQRHTKAILGPVCAPP